MTFWAAREKTTSGDKFAVHVTYGPISITVQEDPGHLRSFHGELGRLLDAAEQEAKVPSEP